MWNISLTNTSLQILVGLCFLYSLFIFVYSIASHARHKEAKRWSQSPWSYRGSSAAIWVLGLNSSPIELRHLSDPLAVNYDHDPSEAFHLFFDLLHFILPTEVGILMLLGLYGTWGLGSLVLDGIAVLTFWLKWNSHAALPRRAPNTCSLSNHPKREITASTFPGETNFNCMSIKQ